MDEILKLINVWIKFWSMVLILPSIGIGCAIAALIIYTLFEGKPLTQTIG
jgi:hypothetical protein